MKVEYISHACLMIDTGDIRIVTDPWFAGPAYCGQWHVFPKPVNVERLHDADVLLISHGHEDHLHEPSLRLLDKDKTVFYPYFLYGGIKEYLESMGFQNVIECHPNKKYQLNRYTSVQYMTNELDSIILIESNGKICVNLNDALHADSEASIQLYTDMIKKKYPHIDILFCGFGGASYYPNTFHVSGKDDIEIGKLREQAFIHNFCNIVHTL